MRVPLRDRAPPRAAERKGQAEERKSRASEVNSRVPPIWETRRAAVTKRRRETPAERKRGVRSDAACMRWRSCSVKESTRSRHREFRGAHAKGYERHRSRNGTARVRRGRGRGEGERERRERRERKREREGEKKREKKGKARDRADNDKINASLRQREG